MSRHQHILFILLPVVLGSTLACATTAMAAVYGASGGVEAGIGAAKGLLGTQGDLRSYIGSLTDTLISYMLFLAVLAIVVAGFFLLLGFGDEGAKDRAKRIIIYTLIAVIIITLAREIVNLFVGISHGTIDTTLPNKICDLVVSALTYVGFIATIAIIVAGFFLLLGFGSESAKDSAKRIILYTILGILVIAFASAIVGFALSLANSSSSTPVCTSIIGTGGSFGGFTAFTDKICSLMVNALTYVSFIGTIAIVIAGFFLLLGFGSEGAKDTAKNILLYTILGILVISFATAIVGFALSLTNSSATGVVCPGLATSGIGNTSLNIRDTIIGLLNYAIGFVALLAVVAIVVAGFMLILGFGTEGSRERAKNIVLYTILGLLVITFARVIISFFLSLGTNII